MRLLLVFDRRQAARMTILLDTIGMIPSSRWDWRAGNNLGQHLLSSFQYHVISFINITCKRDLFLWAYQPQSNSGKYTKINPSIENLSHGSYMGIHWVLLLQRRYFYRMKIQDVYRIHCNRCNSRQWIMQKCSKDNKHRNIKKAVPDLTTFALP
jgi:hypothetical protein